MSFGNAFLHGMKHGVLDGLFWGGFSAWNCTPFFGCSVYSFFSPCFMRFTPYFSIFDNPPALPQGKVEYEIDYSTFWDGLAQERKQAAEIQKYYDKIAKAASEDEVKPDAEKEKAFSSVPNDDAAFNKMLEFVFDSEGGYNANDGGQAVNMGIQQSTYDTYRKNKGLAPQDVKLLTRYEAKDIYYNMYYKASGADKIKDANLAMQVFDTAVNMGVGAAKKLLEECENNPEKFEELRLARYESIAQNNPNKAQYLTGWKNRVDNLSAFTEQNFVAMA